MGEKLKGIGASPGYALGKALIYTEVKLAYDSACIPEERAAWEKARFQKALQESKEQLAQIKGQVREKVGEKEAAVFEAHIMILEDPEFIDKINHKIMEEKKPAPAAVDETAREYAELFLALDNEYMKERAADIIDLKRRLIANLLGVKLTSLQHLEEASIVVAHDLTPSDTALLDRDKVLGLITETGGPTSHTSIMARSMGIPAVVGVPGILRKLSPGDKLMMDGEEGEVIINPGPQEEEAFQVRRREYGEYMERLMQLKDLPAETKDGRRIVLAANIGSLSDIAVAQKYGAWGVGLFRTEFLFMDRDEQPGEEEQFKAYKEVAQAFDKKPVIIRTLDIGGDKNLPYINFPPELNPFLGWRAIRFCLDNRPLFKTQLRAILRASRYGHVKIMYPMIARVEDLQEANNVLAEAKKELREEGIPFDEDIEVGIMVEIPSVAVIADRLAREVDFFSIGTNDLVQYTLAVDRMNEKVSRYYQPFHPAILQLIKMTVEGAAKAGIPVGMCGEMAGNPEATELLVGLGLHELSMSAPSLLKVKEKVRQASYKDCIRLAEEMIK